MEKKKHQRQNPCQSSQILTDMLTEFITKQKINIKQKTSPYTDSLKDKAMRYFP